MSTVKAKLAEAAERDVAEVKKALATGALKEVSVSACEWPWLQRVYSEINIWFPHHSTSDRMLLFCVYPDDLSEQGIEFSPLPLVLVLI